MKRIVRFATRPVNALVLVAVAAFLFAAAATAVHGFPKPLEHDEYSYLLQAETFMSGRLTTPTHPMWRHFETFHVLQQPTYASKYPPANALFIAAGWQATGRPIAGVWFSFVFMCVAICWMLQGWLGPRWGMAISLAFASWVSLSYWSYSYWGGAVAAGAAALVLGAMYRIMNRRATAANAIGLGLGVLLLANSRPYEGMLLAIPVFVVLARWFLSDHPGTWRQKMRSVLIPLAAVCLIGFACMARYNSAVTGSWHQLPYTVYQKARAGAPLFIWQKSAATAPTRDVVMQRFMASEDTVYRAAATLNGRVDFVTSFANDFLLILIPATLLLPFLLIPAAIRLRRIRFALITILWVLFGMAFTAWFLPHYAAPLVGLVLATYGVCLRLLADLHLGARRIGRFLAVSILLLWFVKGAGSSLWNLARSGPRDTSADWPSQRQLIADTLARHSQRNLIIVRYGAQHGPGNEWVYNSANIDASRVVWARDMGEIDNRPLIEYFRDRAAWIVDINDDSGPYSVRPYIPSAP